MSGHSKWAKIKRQKGVKDTKRGAAFTKLARDITVAAQEGGGDPGMNFTLRLAVDKAKQANMPKVNIEQAIKRGTGEAQGEIIHKNTYEAVTSYGVGVLIDTTSDNTNRTYSELKNIVEKAGEKLGVTGSVSWQFSQQGRVIVGAGQIKKAEKYGESDIYTNADVGALEEQLMEIEGLIDYEVISREDYMENISENDEDVVIYTAENFVIVRTEIASLKSVTEAVFNLGWQIVSSDIIWHPSAKVDVAEEKQEKLSNLLSVISDYDDVSNVWTNAEGF